jgi:hypothetical protein
MKTIAETELFTKIALCATLYRLKNEGPYSLYQRYGLASKKNLNAGDLVLVLDDYFPGLVFIPPNSIDISIANYVIQEEGKWILDIYAMAKTKEKIFSSLFPENVSGWDEAKARTRYGCADVIRYFIDTEKEKFSSGFFNTQAGSDKAPGESIPPRFIKELDYNGKPVWEDWNFSTIVIHKLRRRPPVIYEAFGYYARRFYTLMNFGLDSVPSAEDGELIKSGTKLLNELIREEMPETAYFEIDRLTAFFEMIQETLEGVPLGGSMYSPAESDVFIKQLRMKTIYLYKNHRLWKEDDVSNAGSAYNAADRKTINNHVDKAENIFTDEAVLSELKRLKTSGTYGEKINFLHRIVPVRSRLENYSQRERDIIHGLFLKQQRTVSLDRLFSSEDEEEAFTTGHDLIIDEKYVGTEEHLLWTSFFCDEFEGELDKDGLDKFIELLPDHFSKFPFDIDSDGLLVMSKYSRKVLFSTFCSIAGIAPDNELWRPFLVLMQKVVDNINKERNS